MSRVRTLWPQAGLALGMVLNLVGLATGSVILIAAANNLLVVCGLFLGQRRRNQGKPGD